MVKLIILPSWCDSLGGATVSLSMTIAGFARLQSLEGICVPVRAGSLLEEYLQQQGQGACLQPIVADNGHQFYRQALSWVVRQPTEYPLVLENCTNRYLLPILARYILKLKISDRRIYHVFRDLADSRNLGGKLLRQAVFVSLAPGAICNSQFTARSVTQHLGLAVRGILYPPVERSRFYPRSVKTAVPSALEPILALGGKIVLTPSRISEPGHINDKNLRGLIAVLARLKEMGHHYHGVIIGQDYSPEQIHTRELLELARSLSVAERLTILPPAFAIEDYYQYADVVVTLAPREPFGRTVVEAIACGIPVIGSNTGGIGEILHNFAPQWTVNPDDPQWAARAIVKLGEDSQTPSLLTAGQDWVESYCNPTEYAQKMMEIVKLNSLAGSPEQTIGTLAVER